MKFISNKKGFTLIELLVVITLIAILAVAVLAAINPIEQRRKAEDTKVNTSAAQLVSAYDRFYTTYGCFPDDWTTGTCNTPGGGNPTLTTLAGDITKMSDTGELKDETLGDRLNGVTGAVLSLIDGNRLVYCYTPQSESFQTLAKLGDTGTGSSGSKYCIPDSQL